ncbi:hypothetical protein ACTFIW_003815 [Dictyostelium discoideum]
MDEASYEVESILNHDKVKKMYLVKFKGYPEPEWIKEVDTNCEELVREYWKNVQKQLNSRRERDKRNQRNKSKKRKSRNQNTSSDDDDDDDELDLSLQLKTTRSVRIVHPRDYSPPLCHC